MNVREKTIEEIRKFNRYYTVYMELLNLNYLDTPYSIAEIRVLFEIWNNKESIQDTIAQSLQMDKSYLSRILKKLEKNDIVKRADCATDKRKTRVCLTKTGEVETLNLIHQTNKFFDKKIEKLNDAECAELCRDFASLFNLLKKTEHSFKIIPFEEQFRESFIKLNTDWIIDYFGKVEKQDIEEFENIDRDLQRGAMIFFAVENEIVLATCMAKPLDDTTWEICKLGSNKSVPHKGAGSAVFEAAMQWALSNGAERLFILSNNRLKPALHIYQKYGFREIKLDNYEYERGNIAFEYLKKNNF